MKISLNTIRDMNRRYQTTDDVTAIGVEALVEKIGAQLGAVEEVVDIGSKYKGIVVAKVVKCVDHPNADRLHVCTIDDGGNTPGVKRDEDGYIQVVCGAPNVREGLLVAWLPPGSTVPESVGKEPFVLEARELRGVISNGMLASPKELALGDSHEGILEIVDPFDRVKIGDDFAEAFGLKDDVVLDIENKMFTHRPDCFGFLGVSRELAGIQGMAFKSPDWYRQDADIPGIETDELPLQVENELPTLVPRFCAITMRDVTVGPSPVWLQVELAKVGLRSINNIVDYTNFFMLETGQPLHAYDYDKVKALDGGEGASLVIRNPKPGEKIALLNGKTIEPREEAIMIATKSKLIGLGGVMGGSETEVDASTKNIILEAANMDMYNVRRTSMTHGLFTDAVTRFNKGQSPLQNLAVLAKIVDEIRRYADGKVACELIDMNQIEGREWVHPPVPVTVGFINERLGFDLSAEQMKVLLENVEFKVEISETRHPELVSGSRTADHGVPKQVRHDAKGKADQYLTVTAPFWRTDVETREDVVEEIGRLYGFDKLPLELPKRSIKPVTKDPLLELKSKVRATLAKAGANEVLTYSFVHGDLLQKVGQNADLAFRVGNALSPDLQYYRLSLTPSLLDKVHLNIKAGYDEFVLFEIGKGHNLQQLDEDGLPAEFEMLDVVYTRSDKVKQPGAAFYAARKYLTALADAFGVQLELRPIEAEEDYQVAKVYDHPRSAQVFVKGSNVPLGMIGEYKASVRKALKLPAQTAGFGIGLQQLQQVSAQSTLSRYVPLPRFPKVTQDMTLKVPAVLPYQQLFDFVQAELSKLQPAQIHSNLVAAGIYQKPDDTAHKQVTFHLEIASYERTMRDQEVSALLDIVAQAAYDTFGAERI